ncbi:MAG: hypothetical protein F6K31_14755 [Symploca sp. SIO2G7]|nr:hypothetical protein [Symploca sp. SIO2G7]
MCSLNDEQTRGRGVGEMGSWGAGEAGEAGGAGGAEGAGGAGGAGEEESPFFFSPWLFPYKRVGGEYTNSIYGG